MLQRQDTWLLISNQMEVYIWAMPHNAPCIGIGTVEQLGTQWHQFDNDTFDLLCLMVS